MSAQMEPEREHVRLGRYERLARLASGGMAEIYLARLKGPAGFNRIVVIKQVLPHLARRARFRDMFLDEARLVASLHHPNIVQVHELGQEGDELYLVMEYLDGEPLSRVIGSLARQKRTIDFALAAHLVARACHGLHAAHEHVDEDGNALCLVHRDVSPQNLFITYDGAVKVLDFGIAKAENRTSMTATGEVKGKHAYMSPEQCLAEPVDRRTDVFALGTVLWEMTTGKRLFHRDNELLVFKAIVEQPVIHPSQVVDGYPPELERIVLRALEKDREARYPTAAAMRQELLVLAQELAPGRVLEDELGALMRELFPTRIEEKRVLLRKAAEGVEISDVRVMEEGTPDAVPGLASGMQAVPRAEAVASARASADRLARSRAWVAIAGGSIAALAGAVSVLYVATRDPIAAEPVEPPAASGQAEVEPTAPPPAEEATPEPEEVSLVVVSDPAGASVQLDGEARGETPLTLAIPRAETEHVLLVQLDGHAPRTQAFTALYHQRIVLELEPLAAEPSSAPTSARRRGRGQGHAEPPPPTSAPAASPSSMEGDFFRFD
ncbi:MAG: serine/threonine-protein kinase [Sandaracinaceae bacterium]